MSFEVNDFGIPINPKVKKDIKNIKTRLDGHDSDLGDIPNQTYITEKAKTSDVNAGLALKANQSYVDTKFGSMGSTKTFKGSCTDSELSAKTGMVVDDYWYVTDLTTNKCYNGTSWVDIGNGINGLATSDELAQVTGYKKLTNVTTEAERGCTASTGVVAWQGIYSVITADISGGYNKVKLPMWNSTAQGGTLGLAFFNESGTYISGYAHTSADARVTLDIPENATTLKMTYKTGSSTQYEYFDYLELYIDSPNTISGINSNINSVSDRVTAVETDKKSATLDYLASYGYENLISDAFMGRIVLRVDGLRSENYESYDLYLGVQSQILSKGVYKLSKIDTTSFTSDNTDRIISFLNLDTYFWLNKDEIPSGFVVRLSNGAEILISLSDLTEGNKVYRLIGGVPNGNAYVETIKIDGDYVFLHIHSASESSDVYTLSYLYLRATTPYLTVYNPMAFKDVITPNPYQYYKCRAEINHSPYIGKKIVVVGDSQYADTGVSTKLAYEFGATVYNGTWGGHSIKYRTDGDWLYVQGDVDSIFAIDDVEIYVITVSTNDGSGGGTLSTSAINAVLNNYPKYGDDANTISSKLALFNAMNDSEKISTFGYMQTYGALIKQIYSKKPLARIICCTLPIDYNGGDSQSADNTRDSLMAGKLSIRENIKSISEWFQCSFCDLFLDAGISYENFFSQNIDTVHWVKATKTKLGSAISQVIKRFY